MNWDLLDILTFAAMVTALAIIGVSAWRWGGTRAYRFGVAVAAVGAFALAWINGAVGIIGNEENEANLLFFGVLAVGVAGSLIARFRAKGMAIALYATALAQVLVAALAITTRLGASGPAWPRGIMIMTVIFSTFWLVSASLFSKAAKRERRLFSD